jgi:hypothetical protein
VRGGVVDMYTPSNIMLIRYSKMGYLKRVARVGKTGKCAEFLSE